MAVQVNGERATGLPQPRLYVIDFTRPRPKAQPGITRPPLHPHLVQLRRRRMLRRLQRVGGLATWAGGAAALTFLLLGGLAGLR